MGILTGFGRFEDDPAGLKLQAGNLKVG